MSAIPTIGSQPESRNQTQEIKESTHFAILPSPSERIQILVDALLAGQIGQESAYQTRLSCAEMSTWICNHFEGWKAQNSNFQELKNALDTETIVTISIAYTGDKEKTIEKIRRLGGLLYLLHKEKVLARKKITITLPNSEFSIQRKLIGTVAQIANFGIGALVTWLLATQVPFDMMPNDSPWTLRNTWFRNILPPFGMGSTAASIAVLCLPSYFNTCPNKDRLGFMAEIKQDARIRTLIEQGIEISLLFSKQLMKRPKCAFVWQ